MPMRQLAMTLPVNAYTGWGIYGLNLAMQSLCQGVMPVMVELPKWSTLHPFDRALLAMAEPIRQDFERRASANPVHEIPVSGPVLLALGNQLGPDSTPWKLRGESQFATIFMEDPVLTPAAIQKSKTFAKIIAGSTWNQKILQSHGIENSAVVLQGIDPSLFHPAPKSGLWENYFVIFSGGKLEYRKGQDIVIAAVREFQQKHPDAFLAFAWQNANPDSVREIEAGGYVRGVPPALPTGQLDIGPWLNRQGVSRFVDLGPQVNWQMGAMLRDIDVAIFPSRAEGGTNLVAMECMACGIPTILSANTGHLDLISEEVCYPLAHQTPRASATFKNIAGWGESSVEELLELLERIYQDRDNARQRGRAAAAAMAKISWENQIARLLQEVGLLPD
jgi:glycosyltransferase involved in cell wall biosynthesis